MAEAIEEIKRRISLVSLIGEYVSLKKVGTRHKGLCPFHGEKTPSFHVSDSRGYYYCFGCGASGDAIDFLREHVGYSFPEALRLLADRAGVELPERTHGPSDGRTQRQRQESRDRYYDINGAAQRFFRACLCSSGPGCAGGEAEAAVAYLECKRGLERATVDRFGVGYAPDSWDALVQAVGSVGPGGVRDAANLGLVARKTSGAGYYSKFRGRVMFPVYALSGQIAGFSGRTLSAEKDVPKYVNSGESEIYTKGHLLFGLYQARKALREKERAVLVEGNVDVLTLAQAGFEETVAPLGTALTADQCHLLKRFTKTVLVVYDGDDAGEAASLKAVPLLLEAGLTGKAVVLPRGEDPDSFVRANGPLALEELFGRSRPIFEHFLGDALRSYDGTVPGKAAVVAAIAPVFALLKSPEERELYTRMLAAALDVLEGQMERWLTRGGPGQARTSRPGSAEPAPAVPANGRAQQPARPAPRAERSLLRLLLLHPELLPYWEARQGGETLTHEGVRAILVMASDIYRRLGRLDGAELLRLLRERGMEPARSVVGEYLSADDIFAGDAERAFVELAAELAKKAQKRRWAAQRPELVQRPAAEQLAALSSRSNEK